MALLQLRPRISSAKPDATVSNLSTHDSVVNSCPCLCNSVVIDHLDSHVGIVVDVVAVFGVKP